MINPFPKARRHVGQWLLTGAFRKRIGKPSAKLRRLLSGCEELKGLQIYKKGEAAKALKRCGSTRRVAAYRNNGSQRQRPEPAGTDAPGAADRPSSSRFMNPFGRDQRAACAIAECPAFAS